MSNKDSSKSPANPKLCSDRLPSMEPTSPLHMSPNINMDYTPRCLVNTACSPSPGSSEQGRYLEVAASIQPYPVARLLDQITVKNDELHQERQKHSDECKQMREVHDVEVTRLEAANDALKEEVKQERAKYRAEFGRLLEKTERAEASWTTLDIRTSALKAEIDGLRVAGSLTEGTADVSGRTAKLLSTSQELVTVRKEDKAPEGSQDQVVDSQAWKIERTSLLKRQCELEESIIALQGEAKSSSHFIKQLQDRINADRLVHKDQDFENANLKVRSTVYSELLKQLDNTSQTLMAHVQLQTQLILKANEATCSGEHLDAQNSVSRTQEAPVPRTLSITVGQDSADNPAELQSIEEPGQSNSSLPKDFTSNSIVPKGQKRTLSDLIDNEKDIGKDLTNSQRRRTGTQSYVTISPHEGSEESGNSALRRMLSSNWRSAPIFGEKYFGNRSNGSFGFEDRSNQENVIHTAITSQPRAPFEMTSSNQQETIPSPLKPTNGNSPMFKEKPAETQASTKASVLSENLLVGSLPPERTSWQPSEAKAKKWQNSVLMMRR